MPPEPVCPPPPGGWAVSVGPAEDGSLGEGVVGSRRLRGRIIAAGRRPGHAVGPCGLGMPAAPPAPASSRPRRAPGPPTRATGAAACWSWPQQAPSPPTTAITARRSAANCVAVLVAQLGLLGQRTGDHLRPAARACPCGSMRMSGASSLAILYISSRHRVAAERQHAGEHLEQHDAQRVQVGAAVDLLAGDLLGRHEAGRAQHQAGLGLARVGDARDAEVGDLHGVAVQLVHDVGRLDVAVHHVLPVRIGQRLGHARDDGQHLAAAAAGWAVLAVVRPGPCP